MVQQPEGGWWEGQLETAVGWFPCNYVELKPQALPRKFSTSKRMSGAMAVTPESTNSMPDQMRDAINEVCAWIGVDERIVQFECILE